MFEKEKKYFPIKTKTACQLKWNWSTIILTEGTTSSCHRCLKLPLDKDNFDNFHNLPHKIKEREIMLQGKWPTKENGGSGHCTYCKDIEDSGGTSDRMHHLKIPNLVPDELEKDKTATSVTPKVLEIFMNKTCNLKCTYCNTKNSTQWTAEAKKFGPLYNLEGKEYTPYNYRENVNSHRMLFEKSIQWIQKNGNNLRRLHLLGGETFYQTELEEMLSILGKLKNKHLELNIVSNLMVKQEKFKTDIEKIKKLVVDRNIGRFDLTASIDGWGEEAEYVRTGLKIDHWKKLFEFVCKEKWIFLNTNQVITAMTMRSVPALLQVINQHRRERPINQEITFVTGRPFMLPDIFGKSFWANDSKAILDSMPEDTEANIRAKRYMQGCLASIKTEPNKLLQNELKHFLDQLDKRRGTNWRSVFPYLDI